jgi:hypothetical protein
MIEMEDFDRMSEVERRAYLRSRTGLPVPRDGASTDDWQRWIVACAFVGARKLALAQDPPADTSEADVEAARILRSGKDSAELEPYVRRALGETAAPWNARA